MLVRSRSRNTGQKGRRHIGNPLLYAQQYGLLLWLRGDMGIQLGATLRATGTSPPAVTLSGTPTSLIGLHIEIDSVAGGTGLGQATYKWSINNGSSYVATGVLTAAGPTALGTTGASVSFAVGPYNIDNKWDATVAQWNDQSGLGNHAVQATASRQPLLSVAGFGGYSAIDYGVGTTFGFATPSITIGANTKLGALRGDASSGWAMTHMAVANGQGSEVFARSNASISHVPLAGAGSKSAKTISATWLADGVRRTFAVAFNGTHASHLAYRNGVLDATTDVAANDPGAGAQSGPLYIGANEAFTASLRGLYREAMLFSSALPPAVILALHNGMAARAAGAI